MSNALARVFALAAAALLAWLPAAGQTSAGLNGTVTDSSNATVPAARVTITNTETGAQRESLTSDG